MRPVAAFFTSTARPIGSVVVIMMSLGIAAYAVWIYGFRPLGEHVHPLMAASFRAHPYVIYAHIFAAAIALVLGPFQFSRRLRAKRPSLHRWLGRLYLGAGVLVGGLAGLYVALHAMGGPVGRLGFGSLAIIWLFSASRAFVAIRSGDLLAHRQWMVRNFALTFAAVNLRIYLPVAMACGVEFETAYPVIAWLCWVPNLLIAELICKRFIHSASTT